MESAKSKLSVFNYLFHPLASTQFWLSHRAFSHYSARFLNLHNAEQAFDMAHDVHKKLAEKLEDKQFFF